MHGATRKVAVARNQRHLDDYYRALLLKLIIEHRPWVSYKKIAEIFRMETDRSIAESTVRRAEAKGYIRPDDLHARDVVLNQAQQERLDHLIEESAPIYCRNDVARRFTAQTGRRICPMTVGRRMWALGVPQVPKGTNGGGIDRTPEGHRQATRTRTDQAEAVREPVPAPVPRWKPETAES